MRTASGRLCLVATIVGLLAMSCPTVARGQENRDRELATRLDRLERQIQQLVERQERMGGPGPGPQHWQPPQPPGGPEGMPQPGQPPEMKVNWHGPKAGLVFWWLLGCLRAVMFVLLAVHILLAVWVYSDIRKRGEGHGIFVALALLAGIPATILYALIRIGDRKAAGA